MNLAGVTSTIENAHSALLASEKALALVINQLVSGDPPIPTDEHPHPNTILHRLVDASHGLHGTIERVNNLINTLGAQVQE